MIRLNIKSYFTGAVILFALFLFGNVFTAFANNKTTLSVVNAGSAEAPAYALYWPKDYGQVEIFRKEANADFQKLDSTVRDFYVDSTVEANSDYTYKILGEKGELVAASDEMIGKPTIFDVKIEQGSTSKTEASVVVSFKTDKLATSQITYGESSNYGNLVDIDSTLNQSHRVIVSKLKPDTTYHFKLKAIDKSGSETVESEDQTFTTPLPPKEVTILSIIIEALSKAFAGFESWFRS